MTQEQLEAHARMLQSLPVRSHFVTDPAERGESRKGYTRVDDALLAKMQMLERMGASRKEIARVCNVTKSTVTIKLGRRR